MVGPLCSTAPLCHLVGGTRAGVLAMPDTGGSGAVLVVSWKGVWVRIHRLVF